jgi:hydroxymethylglutaryl-CoA lyase
MTEATKIIECPRDAWQGLPVPIAPDVKANYLRKLIAAGFSHIDAVSFVSPAAVPQMADSEQVLADLMPPDHVEIIGIVVNEKGAERAIRTGAVKTLGFPYSVSSEFLRRNQHQTLEESVDALESIGVLASGAGLNVVAYVSMAFGNPYGEPWSLDEVKDACDLLVNTGVQQISLADTVGLATTDRISEMIGEVLAADFGIEIGVHLHARPADAATRIRAAFDAGCRRFDAAIGGLGGCPFAQDVLVGNIPTETLIEVLTKCGAALPNFGPLEDLVQANAEIANRFGTLVQ